MGVDDIAQEAVPWERIMGKSSTFTAPSSFFLYKIIKKKKKVLLILSEPSAHRAIQKASLFIIFFA